MNNIIQKHPELVKTVKETIRDTVKVPEVKLHTVFKPVIDTSKYDSLLNEYARVQNLIVTNSEQAAKQKRDSDKLKKQIIKSIIPDTTFQVNHIQSFTFNDSTFNIESFIQIKLSPEKGITFDYERAAIDIPYVKSITTQTVDARIGLPFYKDWWFWLFILVVVILFRHQLIYVVTHQVKRPW